MEIEECYLQCGKALLRSDLWAARDTAAAPQRLATFAKMLIDQTKLENTTAASLDEHIQRSYNALY